MDAMIVGNKIAKYRKEKNMTQQQLAEKLAVTNKAVSKWETGAGLPDIAILPILASELGVSLDDLVSEEDYSVDKKQNGVFRRYVKKPVVRIMAIVILIAIPCAVLFSLYLNNESPVMDYEIIRVGLPDGYHVHDFLCGCTYEGYWENGLPNGPGKYTQPMMEGISEGMAILEGYFIDGIAHGMVTYTRIWPDRTWVFEFEADMGYQIEDSVMSEEGIFLPARFPLVIHLVMDHYLATNENWQS
jgi:transcriptional regulator with XRE-family HTH domain